MSVVRYTSTMTTTDQGIVSYPFFAKCRYCNQDLQFDIDLGGTPGRNGDWSADGDYGCDADPRSNEDGCWGHTPIDIRYESA